MAAKPLQRLERPPTLHRFVQDTLKNYIADNGLQPGDALPPETELARQLGISRNSVREAVKALETIGVLETRRGNGLYVREFSFEPILENLSYGLMTDLRKLDELFVIRQTLEAGLIGAAMEAMTDEQRDQLVSILDDMRQRAERGEPFASEDRQFHQALFESLGNETLLKMLDLFWLTFRSASQSTAIIDRNPMQTYQDHADILEAVLARDVARARAALTQHYHGLSGRLARAQQARHEGDYNL
jgi:DNA-binding FadR family transcriptional regulator